MGYAGTLYLYRRPESGAGAFNVTFPIWRPSPERHTVVLLSTPAAAAASICGRESKAPACFSDRTTARRQAIEQLVMLATETVAVATRCPDICPSPRTSTPVPRVGV